MEYRKLQVLKYPDENNAKRILSVSEPGGPGDVLAYVEKEMKDGSLMDIAKRYNAYLDLVRHMDGILCELEDSGTVTHGTVTDARKTLEDLGWNEQALGELADHFEGPAMNIYQWAENRKVDELAAHAIAYHFAGYKDADNPFTAKGSFYRSGWTSIRDSNNPVPHQWSVYLFEQEATIAPCLEGLNVVDTEQLDTLIDELNEQARLSYEAMKAQQ